MEYRRLGRTGLDVSVLSLGTGGARQLGQKAGMSQTEQTRFVRRALDLGVNFIDTSSDYGESEVILGKALKGVPRDSYYLCTKWPAYDGMDPTIDPTLLVASFESSLRRLDTDYVEVMMFHGPLASHYDNIVEHLYPTMERLREQGKLGFIGLSAQYASDPEQAVAEACVKRNPELWDVLMVKYGLLNQSLAREVLPLAIQHDIGIMNMAAIRVKLPDPALLEELMREWAERGYVAEGDLSEEDPLGWLVHDDVTSAVAAGYKFAADHPAISTVVTGTSNFGQLRQPPRRKRRRARNRPYLSAERDTRRVKELFGDIVEYV